MSRYINSMLAEDGFIPRLIKLALRVPLKWIIIQLIISSVLFVILVLRSRNSARSAIKKAIIQWMLLSYIVLILIFTIFSRSRIGDQAYEIELFASYKKFMLYHDEDILWESLYNIIMFIPIGLFSCNLLKFKGSMIFGLLLSSLIEIVQYSWCIGTFEVDDIFNNTLGVFLGYIFMMVIKGILKILVYIKKYVVIDSTS